MIRALLIYGAYAALGLSPSYSALFSLDAPTRKSVLVSLQQAYRVEASREYVYLTAIVLSRSMRRWAAESEAFEVLPSQILSRLEEGLRRQKRYLGLWVQRWLKQQRAAWMLRRETEASYRESIEPHLMPLVSDPLQRRAIERALAQLSPTHRAVIELLIEDCSPVEIAQLRGCSHEAAKQQVVRARAAFALTLQKNLQRRSK